MAKLKLYPVSLQSEVILKTADFALIGISPFSSYFSVENMVSILYTIIDNFNDFAIFIPDQISSYTLQALGYETKRIIFKTRKQDNYLKNKAIKALSEISKEFNRDISNKIITLSSLLNNTKYINSYNAVIRMFNENKSFEQGCIRTSNWIISNHSKQLDAEVEPEALIVSVQYFLRELPIFLCASEILNVRSCCFIYPSIPKFLNEIYNQYNLISKTQGFVIIQ